MKDSKKEKTIGRKETDRTGINRRMDRREFLEAGAKLGIAATILGAGGIFAVPPARAAKSMKGTGEVIVCGWGGGFQDAMRKTVFEPFTRETGIKVIDTATPSSGKVKAQVDSGNIEWDVALLSYLSGKLLGEKYLEKIDYGYFDEQDLKNIPEGVRKPLSCGAYFFSYIIAYNSKKYPEGKHPKSWADFIDFQQFPGKRVFSRPTGGGHFHVECAQLAMGVPREKLYPPDMEKAWAFYNKLKPNCLKWWSDGAQPIQMLQDGEVDICNAYNGRVQQLIDDGLPFRIEWNQGELAENSWCVLKNAKNAENAMKLIAFSCRPQVQAALAELYPYGPSNLLAVNHVSPKIREKLNTAPGVFEKQVLIDWDWYLEKTIDPSGKLENREYLANQWQEWVMK
jgi:putative spermidine/putrescine transport system substrate-binding protein